MSDSAGSSGDESLEAPSMLDLVRLSPKLLFPPGGRDLYRQIALLAELSEDDEVLVVGSANGVTLEYFVTEYGVHGSGVDFDEPLVTAATQRAKARDLAEQLQYQRAPLDHLPYRDEIFDVTVGELGLTAHADPHVAMDELVRVTRPGGRVVVVQLVWKAPVDEARRRVLAEHLGVKPLMLVEWKRLLREAGVENLHTEDWTDEETAFRPHIAKPFPDFAELFSLPEKIGILRRAWRRWGWSGVRTVLVREREVHKLLTRERILGLTLVTGVKAAAPEEVEEESGVPQAGSPVEPGSGSEDGGPAGSTRDVAKGASPAAEDDTDEPAEADPGTGDDDSRVTGIPSDDDQIPADTHGETRGLPLFGRGDENA